MKRRDFLKNGTAAVGLAGALKFVPPPSANGAESSPPAQADQSAPPVENRSADYLRRAQEDKFLPKPPLPAEPLRPGAVQISPMPLAERIRRKIVPRRGFCSICRPASGVLLSGNGAVSIELDVRSLHRTDSFPPRNAVRAASEARRGAQHRGYFPAGAANAAGREIPRSCRNLATRNGTQTPSRGVEWGSAEARGSPCVLSFRKARRSRTISARLISRAPR